MQAKEQIRIRSKPLANGNKSLYLDFYNDGRRKYEFLKLYIIPEKTKEDKSANINTLQLANAIKAKRIVELQNNQHGFSNSSSKSKISLVDYIQQLSQLDPSKTGRNISLNGLIHHLNRYDPHITLKQLNKAYIQGFIEYLKTAKQQHCAKNKTLNINTQAYYLKILRWCLSYAVSDDVINSNPTDKIRKDEKPICKQSDRDFLTIDEIKKLAATPIHNDLLKRAFLFACFCGLRHCDVVALKWNNIRKDESGNYTLKLTQQKTQNSTTLPLSDEAYKLLPAKGHAKSQDTVFNGLFSLGYSNEVLPRWAKRAGINKHVTFHISRHTYATMMLTLGADLYTVSDLLGHKNIQVTQIYAKIIDEKKRLAVNLIPDILSELTPKDVDE